MLKYLARYTHRVAISNSRVLGIDGNRVRFRWKDRAGDGRSKAMTLEGVEFVRRFLQHVLPKGFMRIRYFGFLANGARKEKLPLARRLLRDLSPDDSTSSDHASTEGRAALDLSDELDRCPKCEEGRLSIVGVIAPECQIHDTS